MKPFKILICTTFVLFVAVPAFCQVPAAIAEIESKALSARRAITDIYLKLETKTTINTIPREGDDGVNESVYEIWSDQSRTRVDRTSTGVRIQDPRMRRVECQNFKGNGIDITFDDHPSRAARQVGPSRNDRCLTLYQIVDPRSIGFVPTDYHFLAQPPTGQLVRHIGSPERSHFEITTELMNGRQFYVVKSHFKTISHMTHWYDPQKNYSPVRILSVDLDTKGELWSSEINNILKEHRPGIWFVDSYRLKRKSKSATQTREVEEIGNVIDVSLNTGLTDVPFTLSGMGMRPGTTVYDCEKKADYIFAPEKVVPTPNRTINDKPPVPLAALPNRNGLYWLTAGLVSAFVAAFAAYRLLIRPKRTPRPEALP